MGDIVAMGDIGDANVGMQTLMLWLNLQPSHGMDIVAMGDTGDANVVTLTLMLLLIPSLSHGMDIEDMVDTGAANVAPLKLSHGTMEDMDTVDTGDKIKVDDGTNFPLRQNEKAYGSDNNKIVLIIGWKLF